MHRGYVKLWRRLQFNEIWIAEKFTRGQALVDLIMVANHKQGHIRKRGIKIKLNRGDIGYSERELAERWKWSRGKVRRFLFELCSGNDPILAQQNGPQNKNVTSSYKILKYNLYQGDGPQKGPQTVPQTGHKQYQNNNDKNDKNKKSTADGRLLEQIDEWAEKLYRANKFDKVHAFKNKMLKDSKNAQAVLYTLKRLAAADIPKTTAWAYCCKIMQVENGNFNEADYRKRADQQKRDLEQWANNL